MPSLRIIPNLLSLLLLSSLLAGCVAHQQLLNYEDVAAGSAAIDNTVELTIQPDDLLRIDVHSANPKAAAPYNMEPAGQQQMMNLQQMGVGSGSTNGLELFTGYFVDQDGAIDFPGIGKIQVGGLTIRQAKEKILQAVKPYLQDAVVNMRFLNLKITVTGEVNGPGLLRLSNQRVTVLEAIGMAGDLTPYANRENILLIREKEGQREYVRLNLQDKEIFNSPYFYLQQNDVLYIEPIRARIATVADPAQRIIGYASGLISIVTLIIALGK